MPSSPFDRLMRKCVERFGVKATYLRDDRKIPVEGIFDNDFEMVVMDKESGVVSKAIKFGMHKDAIPFEPKRGDRLRIGKQVYRIDHAEPDSEYGLDLILKKA